MRPEAMNLRAYWEASAKRLLRMTMSSLPAFSEASFMARAFSGLTASGFSQKTCFFALKAATAISEWRSFGVQMSTASTSFRLSSSR